MADRTVKVSLVAAVGSYIADMDKAAKKTGELGSEAEKLAQKKEAFASLGAGALAFGAIAAAAVGIAVAKFAEFDAAMSNVKAATQESASNMDLLRSAALSAGAETVFSATEAAGAIEELGKAGLSTDQILSGGLNGALSLAAAGQLEVADAAQITAIALKQFGLGGDQASHVADLLAAGAGKAVGDVSDLAAALGQAGLVANGAGQSIEDTTGVLAAFADAGLLGSDAGTSLKTAIVALQAPTAKSKALMDEYNLSFYDGNGQMLSYSEIAGQLKTKLGGLDDETRNAALAQIFGNDALRSANVLYEQGAAGIQKYVDQTNDSGYAAQVAADRLDNLKGDVEALGGSIETALINTGSGANNSLRELTQSATFLVNIIGGLPEPVLGTGLAIGAVAAAMALTGGAALTLIPKISATIASFQAMGVSAKSAALGVGAVGLALGALVLGGAVIINYFAEVSAGADEFSATLDKSTGAITKYSREMVAKKLAESNASDISKLAGVSQKELTDAVLEGGDALDKIIGKLNDKNNIVDFFNGSGIAAGNARDDILKLSQSVEQGQDQWESYKAGLAEVEATSEEQSQSLASLAGAADDTTDSVQALADEIRNFGSAQFDVEQAGISFQQSLADLDAALAEGAGSLDISTEAGRRTQSAMLDVAQSANEFAAAQVATGASTESVQGTLEAGRQKIINTRVALGDSAQAAQDYADRLLATPESIETAVRLEKAAAEQALYELTRDRYVNVTSRFITGPQPVGSILAPNEDGNMYVGGKAQAFANGGFPTGIYAGRSGGIHKFAEENVGWEAYVSGKPGQEARNRGILMDAASRLGMGSLVPAGGAGSQTIQVQLSTSGGAERFVDVRINGALVAQEKQARADQQQGWGV